MPIVRLLVAVLVVAVGAGVALQKARVAATAESPVALTGHVTSAEEGPMEGVLVSANKVDSTITTTVVTDDKGRYSFPSSRLEPGHYTLRTRAVGYDLEGPNAVEIGSGKPVEANLELRNTADLGAQLTNTEWLMSFPGTPEQKASIQGCNHCHTYEPIVRSRHDADEFVQVLERMSHYPPQSFPLMIQAPSPRRVGDGVLGTDQQTEIEENRRKQAAYLATLNLSTGSQWSYALKTLPRPRGKATRVVITEYDLPKRTRQPHDVIVDSAGMAWYAGFGEAILGKLDPKTGKITEYPMPVLKPKTVIGNLDVEFDRDENIWIAMTFQAAVAKFDRKTEKFQVFRLPPELDADYQEITFVAPNHSDVDGKVWMTDGGLSTILRVDIASGKFEMFEPFAKPRPYIYETVSDEQNNAWFMVIGAERVGRIDAKTGKITLWQTPTPQSAPRRGKFDAQGHLWFGENRANKVGMFETKTGKFQEWEAPTPDCFPYDVAADKNGEAWASNEFSDTVLRLDSHTGEIVQYLLPRHTDMRRAFVDNSTTPVTFWVGNTHAASVIRVEPLDSPPASKR